MQDSKRIRSFDEVVDAMVNEAETHRAATWDSVATCAPAVRPSVFLLFLRVRMRVRFVLMF